jgi:hypothetical protein
VSGSKRSTSSPTAYFKIEDIEACEEAGCIPHVPKPQRGSPVREGFSGKDEFRYDAGRARVGSCWRCYT